MIFQHRYAGASSVRQAEGATAMSFAPDTLRTPTYFRGQVARQLEFREAMSALHDVVISDLRFVPKDRTAYLAWRERQSYVDLAAIGGQQQAIGAEITRLTDELRALDHERSARWSQFYSARKRYFDYLYDRDKELWFKLDPVITVHPDQVFFECFSRDESSYGRLAASYEVFEQLGERANGTTNIDYSQGLYDEFQKIRTYKTTTLDVDPSGFGVETAMEERFREVKIDLPDSWVRGFLQVSSAMTLPAQVVDLHPMDVHNLCFVLRRNKELFGPRSLRWQLTPGGPAAVVVEPWNHVVRCPRSVCRVEQPVEIRMWGRRRLHILERLLPRARRVRLHLLGSGLPTFWVVDLGDLSFTLGLSGWTHNDWAQAGNFDLMAAREDVDGATQERVFAALGQHWLATPDALAKELGLNRPIVASALAGWVQCGRAIFDLDRGVYRKRELTREPLPIEQLRYANEREQAAARLLHEAKIAVDQAEAGEGLRLVGRLKHRDRLFTTELVLDADRRLVEGECSCDFFIHNRLHRGPCEHMLALRAAQRRGVSDLIDLGDYQDTFRRAYAQSVVLRGQRRPAEAVRELLKASRLMPAASPEAGRLQEAIAEAQLEADDPVAASAAARRALRILAKSPLSLRVLRAALAAQDVVPEAIEVGRTLCEVEDKVEHWEALAVLCQRDGRWAEMLAIVDDALARHPKAKGLTQLRASAVAGVREAAGEPVEDLPAEAAKPGFWKRLVARFSGKKTE